MSEGNSNSCSSVNNINNNCTSTMNTETDNDRPDWRDANDIFVRKVYQEKTCDGWNESEYSIFKLRSATYLQDKIKEPSQAPAYSLCGVNVFKTDRPLKHVSKWIPSLKKYMEDNKHRFLHYFVVTWMLPGPPYYVVVHLFGRTLPYGVDLPFDRLMKRFIEGDATFRNNRFKYICKIVKGPWAVKLAANQLGGNRPAILGNKLIVSHYGNQHYVELDIDVGSSRVASTLNGLILRSAKSLCVDEGFLLEGQDEEELPERLICSIRFIHCNLKNVSIDIDLPGDFNADSDEELIK